MVISLLVAGINSIARRANKRETARRVQFTRLTFVRMNKFVKKGTSELGLLKCGIVPSLDLRTSAFTFSSHFFSG